MGNVISTATTLTSGTDTQAFCYDEQNRLTWASATTGTPPCGGSLTGGTLTSAQYIASYAYDTLGRLTSAPLGTSTYGDASHQDAATAVGTTYTASYDAAGDMTCRAPTNTVTCAGTPTGSVMTYDNERRLATWQNTPSAPTSTAAYWYDGEGTRVAQTLNGTTTYYVGNDEEITGSTLLKYYHIPGLPVLGTITGVTRTYLASDGLGSETVDLSYNGSVLATALYGPYGVGRYATGTMPTSKGYTGQRQDSGSGLDYYGARYYDASVGQFTSADTVQGPNRYGYVGGNPETATDPSGKVLVTNDEQSSDDSGDPDWSLARNPQPRANPRGSFAGIVDSSFYDNGHFDDKKHSHNHPEDPIEIADGTVLAEYFKMHVDRIQTRGSNRTADYEVYAEQEIGSVLDHAHLESDHVPVELLTPENNDWDNPHTSYGGGIVRDAYNKGDQASIVVIDLRYAESTGKLNDEQFYDYASRIVLHPYAKGPDSQVARVIFIRDGKVAYDYNPLDYGPEHPPDDARPAVAV